MKTLDLEFLNEIGKAKHLRLAYAAQDLDEVTVKKAMDTIAGLKMFEKDLVNPYATPSSAQYIERTVTPIFNAMGDDNAKADAA
jgi:hypothetical protein